MTTTATERAEHDFSAAVWDWLQHTDHFTCGGWSWDSRKPDELLCACGSNVMSGDGEPPC